MAAAYAAGYMVAVPVLTALTDRYDARRILWLGSLFTAVATLGFGWLAQGLVSAMVFWGLAGMGFAGAYMPGLRALTDRLDPRDTSRSVTLYTSSFSLGVGLSFLVSQLAADHWGWRWSFYLTGLGPLVMVCVALAMKPVQPPAPVGHLLDFRPVLRNRPTLGYILGYGAHCFELYGMRTWIVAFWTFVMATTPAPRCLRRLSSASWSRCWPCPRVSGAMSYRSVTGATGRSRGSRSPPLALQLPSDCCRVLRRGRC